MSGTVTEEELLAQARAVMDRAYAPYSGFRVGAALEAEGGTVYVGCNVENASYPVGTCAERVALGHAVASGARSFRRVAVVSSGDRAASPCGMCRQALFEFAPDLEVVCSTVDGEPERWVLTDLLPAGFRLDEADPAGAAGRGV